MSQHTGRIFTVCIDTGNVAFDDANTEELPRILRELAQRIETQGAPFNRNFLLHDINGNVAGSAKFDTPANVRQSVGERGKPHE